MHGLFPPAWRILATLIACLATAPFVARADSDPWFGQDKALHLGASSAISATGYGVTALLSPSPELRLLVGGSVGLGAGVAKELLDLSGSGTPSWRDLAWDVVGTAIGLAVTWALDGLLIAAGRHALLKRLPESPALE